MLLSATSSSLQGNKFHKKTRVVFDGGVTTSNGLSLNVILKVGSTVKKDLYSIVLRFRTHQVCFTADIEKTGTYREFYGDVLLTNPYKGTDSQQRHMELLVLHFWLHAA